MKPIKDWFERNIIWFWILMFVSLTVAAFAVTAIAIVLMSRSLDLKITRSVCWDLLIVSAAYFMFMRSKR